MHEFVSQDGVFEDPSWTAPYGFPDAMGRDVAALTDVSLALLLGRRTYEMFAPAWSGRTAADDPGAPFFNDSPTYVASSTLTAVDEWQNSEILGPYDTKTIRNLKQ